MCPHCGIENSIMFCPECDKQLSANAIMCPECGYEIKKTSPSYDIDDRGKDYGMALTALILNFFGLSVVSLILGYIVKSSNRNQRNDATRLANTAIIIGWVMIALIICFIFLIFILVTIEDAYYYLSLNNIV